MTEIYHFVEDSERPDDLVLDRRVARTGLFFPQHKRSFIEEFVENYEYRLYAPFRNRP